MEFEWIPGTLIHTGTRVLFVLLVSRPKMVGKPTKKEGWFTFVNFDRKTMKLDDLCQLFFLNL